MTDQAGGAAAASTQVAGTATQAAGNATQAGAASITGGGNAGVSVQAGAEGVQGTPQASREGLNALAGQQAATQAQAAAQDGPKGYWPDAAKELADKYRGVDDKSTIDRLIKEIAEAPRAPAKADDYKLALSEDLTKRYSDLDNDPVLSIWRDVAFKNGLTDQQFNGAISQLYGELIQKGLIEPPLDTNAEIEKLMPSRGTPIEREAEAMRRINGVHNQLTGLVQSGTLSRKEANMVQALAATADGVMTLEKLFTRMGEHGLQSGGRPSGVLSKDELEAQMRDERYDSRSSKYDKKFRARVDADWRRLHSA